MKKALLSFIAMMLACLTSAQVQITEAQALQLVKNHRALTVDSANYFAGTVMSVINDRIRCDVDATDIQQNQWVNTNDEKWLIFVDEQPKECWDHKCTYYYLPKQVVTLDDVPILELQGFLPPSRVHLTCIERNTLINMPEMPRLYNYSNLGPLFENKYAENTKVLIVWGFDSDLQMYGDYINCSNFYKVLTTKYLIPKSNIHILMGTGDPDDDLMPDNSPMPKDFDGDGIDESVHVSSALGFTEAINQIGRERTDNLLVFYVGDMGYNIDGSRILILRGGEMTVNMLNTYLNKSRARYINNFIRHPKAMDFVTDLQSHNNRTLTICFPLIDWESIYKYANNWIGAFAGVDWYTGSDITSLVDTNSDDIVSFSEAANYADIATTDAADEFYQNPSTLGNVLSLNRLPEDYCLFLRDNNYDPGVASDYPDDVYWNSPDIWIRNIDDGFVNHENNHITSDLNNQVYIYTRVNNRGYLDYDTYNKYLKLFWKSNTLRYTNSEVFTSGNLGGTIATIALDSVIEADTSRIFRYQWTVPAALVAKLQSNAILDFEVMGMICDNTTAQIPVDADGMPALYQNSNLATHRANTVWPVFGNAINPSNPFQFSTWRTSIPIYMKTDTFHQIRLGAPSSSALSALFNYCNVVMELSPSIVQENPDFTYSNMTRLSSTRYKFNNINAACEFSVPQSASLDSVMIHFEYKGLTPGNAIDATFNIIDCEVEDIFKDAESYRVYIAGIPSIPIERDAQLGIGIDNCGDNGCQLVALNVSEPSRLEWYGPGNEMLGRGETLQLGICREQGEYKLRTVSLKDATVSYATITLGSEISIDRISPNPFSSQFTVQLTQPATANMTVRLSPVSGGGRAIELPVATGDQEIMVSASDIPSGVYAIGLCQNGTMIDNRRVIKQ